MRAISAYELNFYRNSANDVLPLWLLADTEPQVPAPPAKPRDRLSVSVDDFDGTPHESMCHLRSFLRLSLLLCARACLSSKQIKCTMVMSFVVA